MVKILSDSYGLTKDAAMWSVVSWFQMLKLEEVADALETTAGQATSAQSESNMPLGSQNPLRVQCGIYKCGYDFSPEDIRLKVISIVDNEQAHGQGIYYAVLRKGAGSSIIENGFFKGQVVLCLKEGQRLEIGWQGEAELISI